MKRQADELQIQIDDVYACLGQCGGCILSATERKSRQPDMSPEILELATARLIEHAATVAPLRRVNLTFGIADHLLMDDAYILDIYRRGAEIVRAGRPTDTEHSGVFFTTSLIGKADQVIARLRELKRQARLISDVPLLPLVVLDPRLMNATKFGPQWREMVIAAREMFGEIDLSINLSDEAVAMMTPAELIEFADVNAFNEVTVNWVPTLTNAHRTLSNIEATLAWLVGFDELAKLRPGLGTSFRPVITRTIDSLMCSTDGTAPSVLDVVRDILPETVSKSIEIDQDGYLLPKLEAVGDTAHSERFGLASLGHLSVAPIADLLAGALPKMQRRIISIHSQGACATCPVSSFCAATGFHVATHVGRQMAGMEMDDACPHVAATLISRIHAELVDRDLRMSA